MLNGMSVDVEDYFHTEAMSSVVPREQWDQMPSRVEMNTHFLFDLFEKKHVRATFFFLGWVAERSPSLVREALRRGHELGCHSHWHRRVNKLSHAEFREDTRRAKEAIEDASGSAVLGYRAPSFSMVPGTEWATEILVELGFQYDSSVHPIRHDLYGNPHAPTRPFWTAQGKLLEIPVATTRVAGSNWPVGGGGYLRMFPYQYIRWGIRRVNHQEKRSAVVYTHPWEFDAEQPRLKASMKSRLRQYIGLGRTARSLGRLMDDFSFVPIRELISAELEHHHSFETGACANEAHGGGRT